MEERHVPLSSTPNKYKRLNIFVHCLVTIVTTYFHFGTDVRDFCIINCLLFEQMAAAAQYRTRFAPKDWTTANTMMSSTAERQRSTSYDTRQKSQQLQNLTENKTHWTQHDTETKLQERIADINSWKNTLEMVC